MAIDTLEIKMTHMKGPVQYLTLHINYSRTSISVTPISVIISYMLRKFYSPTICKTSECYVLSVITCVTPFFVNYTSISVNFENIKVAIVCQCGKFQKILLVKWSLLANIQVDRTMNVDRTNFPKLSCQPKLKHTCWKDMQMSISIHTCF